MITVNRMNESIVGSINNEQFGVPFNEEKYSAMLELQTKADNAETVDEFKQIVEDFKILLEVDYNDVIESKCKDIYFNKAKGTYHLKIKDSISSVPMPQALVDRILDSMDKGIDFTPLVKMWMRWLRNPVLAVKTKYGRGQEFSERMFNYINANYINHELKAKLMDESGLSEEVATERATTKQVGITVEGLLRTFKVSKEIHTKYELDEDGDPKIVLRAQAESIDPDTGLITYQELTNEERLFQPAVQGTSGDAFFCGVKEGHFIKVGQRHYLSDWSKVNTDDHVSCVKGLHCGGLDYIKGYQDSGTETHNILVDPANIGAIPDDRTGAIRVFEYYVLDAFSGVNGSIYHSSTYAAQSDKKWEEDKAKILEEYGKLQEDITKELDEIKAL